MCRRSLVVLGTSVALVGFFTPELVIIKWPVWPESVDIYLEGQSAGPTRE